MGVSGAKDLGGTTRVLWDRIHVPLMTAPFPFISFSSPMMSLATLEISRSIS